MYTMLNLVANNQPQVMPRILRVFTSQGMIYQNLWVSVTEDAKFLMLEVEAKETGFSERFVRLLEKLVDVIEVKWQV
ncbi:MAG: hypothetical protein E6713_16580 [Sporomusaceae bacterium]|nr:hypothetical protein [Sporomusaceae bacterium]